MNGKDLRNGFNEVDDDILERSEAATKRKSTPAWLKWGALAACLCLALAIAIPTIFHQPAESPNDTISAGVTPPSVAVNGVNYCISSYSLASETLPDGYVLAGKTNVEGFYDDCPYYTNPHVPEWIYVYHEITSYGTFDESGIFKLNKTEPQEAYVLYVDGRICGKRLICYQGEYYIHLPSAQTYGSHPDVTHEYWNKMERTYGIQFEGNIPDGFVSAGITEFSGYDTIPRGDLVSNIGDDEVFVNPSNPNVVFVTNLWLSPLFEENGETIHGKFDVYIRYDCPIA